MERWCQTNAIGSLHGRCRVHRAEILRLRGACGEAEREALLACEELRPYLRREMGWPLSELGRIRLRRGDVDGAEEALLAAHRVGWEPQPGLALVRLARGEAAAAAAAIRDALEHPSRIPSKELPPDTDLQRAPLLDAQVEIEIAAGDLGRARVAADELERVAARFQSTALVAGAALARGRVRLAEGRAADAERCCSQAARLWNEIGAPYEAARARVVLAEALRAGGSEDQALLELQASRTIFERIEGPTHATIESNVFRREGDFWLVVFEGRTVRVRDLKGMRYLGHLLAHPRREFHVLDLVAAETGQRMALGDAGEILDERAKSAYRRRLAEIEDDRGQARSRGRQAGSASRRRARLPDPRARARRRPGWSRSAGRIRLGTRSIRCDPRDPPGDSADRRTPPRVRRTPQSRRSHRHALRLCAASRRPGAVNVVRSRRRVGRPAPERRLGPVRTRAAQTAFDEKRARPKS